MAGAISKTTRTARITYTTESGRRTEREVEPYGLVGRRGHWYLVGYCRLRADFRTFRLDRMVKTQLTQTAFHPDERFDYRAYAVETLESFPWNLEYTEDGIILHGRADNWGYEARFLAELGLPFRVIEPEELAALLSSASDPPTSPATR